VLTLINKAVSFFRKCISTVPTQEVRQSIAGRNHNKSAVESSKIPRPIHLLSAKASDRVSTKPK
jgi:hypothetical protein